MAGAPHRDQPSHRRPTPGAGAYMVLRLAVTSLLSREYHSIRHPYPREKTPMHLEKSRGKTVHGRLSEAHTKIAGRNFYRSSVAWWGNYCPTLYIVPRRQKSAAVSRSGRYAVRSKAKRCSVSGGIPPALKKGAIMNKKQIIKIIISVLIAALTALGAAFGLNSCNVVRTITNKSEFYQRGDTSCQIVTKTIESYDATRK